MLIVYCPIFSKTCIVPQILSPLSIFMFLCCLLYLLSTMRHGKKIFFSENCLVIHDTLTRQCKNLFKFFQLIFPRLSEHITMNSPYYAFPFGSSHYRIKWMKNFQYIPNVWVGENENEGIQQDIFIQFVTQRKSNYLHLIFSN